MAFPIMAAALGLASFAPLITRWLEGDKAQEAAAKAVSLAQTITGALDPLEAFQKLQGNADLASEFQKAIIQAEMELELATLKDRQHARMRDMSITNVKRSNIRADILAIGASGGLFLCLVFLAYFKPLPEAIGVISTVAGVLGACLKDVYAFEFGSSRGSKEKDDTVAALMERNNL
jgi:hypothetical protein